MEQVSSSDVKVRIRELPAITALQPDHKLVADGEASPAGKVAPAEVVTAGYRGVPEGTARPSRDATLLMEDAGQVRRYLAVDALGQENVYYLGPFATAPTLQPSGLALVIGNLYLNTTNNQTYVYLGTGLGKGWQVFGAPYPANQITYVYYFREPTQIIGGRDELGQELTYSSVNPDTVNVYLNGARLVAQSDFQLLNDGTIRLIMPAPANSICEVVVRKFAELDYTAVPTLINTSGWVKDGVEVSYRMQDNMGEYITPASSANCTVVINGLMQQPEVDYTVNGDRIRFTTPPPAGSRLWVVVGVPLTPPYVTNVLVVDAGGTELSAATGVGVLTASQTYLPPPDEVPVQLPAGLVPVEEAPVPSEEYHGQLMLLSRPALVDALYVCVKTADEDYAWQPILYQPG